VAITPDGKQVVSASSDNTLKLWDLATGSELATLSGHSQSVNAVAITPDGKQAVSASWDDTLKLWDLLSGRVVATFWEQFGFNHCAVVPDTMTVVAGDESGLLHFLRLEMDAPLASPSDGSENPLSLLSQGLSLVQQGREDEAISCWEKAVKLRTDAASVIWEKGEKALCEQGEALWKAENYEGAVRCFQRLVQLQPDKAEYWHGLAISQQSGGDAEAALSSYETALNLQPDNPIVWDNRGYTFHALGRYEEAMASYQKALELDSNHANVYYNIACLYGVQGDVDVAIHNLKRAIELDSKYRDMAKTDSDCDRLRQNSQFQALLEE
jgi:tetratricopeptide (TPR) repeat protein